MKIVVLDAKSVDRRAFLRAAAATLPCLAGCGLASAAPPGLSLLLPASDPDAQFTVEARYYEKLEHKKIKCKLCPRECVIDDRERGYCGARENRGGTYYTLVHSRVATAHIDPIEKKPLFHFLPGTAAFSIATAGCNVNCKFCQNWEISQVRPEQVRSTYMPPRDLAALARQYQCPTIAYTYSEPVIFYEYVSDTAEAGHAQAAPAFKSPIKILVGFAPGGSSDVAARMIAEKISGPLGVPVVVENRPGAGGRIAGEALKSAPADGTTMMMTATGAGTQNPAVDPKSPYRWDEPTIVARVRRSARSTSLSRDRNCMATSLNASVGP